MGELGDHGVLMGREESHDEQLESAGDGGRTGIMIWVLDGGEVARLKPPVEFRYGVREL